MSETKMQLMKRALQLVSELFDDEGKFCEQYPDQLSAALEALEAALALPADPPVVTAREQFVRDADVVWPIASADAAQPQGDVRLSDSIVYLPCGHGKFDTRRECLTCLQYVIKQLNQRLSNTAIDLSQCEQKLAAAEARGFTRGAWEEHQRHCSYCGLGVPGCGRGRFLVPGRKKETK